MVNSSAIGFALKTIADRHLGRPNRPTRSQSRPPDHFGHAHVLLAQALLARPDPRPYPIVLRHVGACEGEGLARLPQQRGGPEGQHQEGVGQHIHGGHGQDLLGLGAAPGEGLGYGGKHY